MSTAAASGFSRRPADGPLGGVCAGLGRALGIDPLLLRVGFVAAATAGGMGVLAYALLWALLPGDGREAGGLRAPRRGSVRVAVGTGLLVLSAMLLLRHYGLWFGDVLVWPFALAVSGAALIWRQTQERPAAAASDRPWEAVSAPAPPPEPAAAGSGSRALVGSALVIGGGLVFLYLSDALEPARDVVLAVVVVLVAGGLVLAPWWIGLVRRLAAERGERIRSQERAEVAAHLHDSVLQTLALMQKRADDPRAVSTLARRQERELRAWLDGAPPPGTGSTLAAALQRVVAEAEDRHGVEVELVTVGDRPLDDRVEALVAAAGEALNNAAKFAGSAPISVYAEATGDRAQVFVRDRGPGFDPSAVPADRRGVRESIVGRMERHGGGARIASDGGTEVELWL